MQDKHYKKFSQLFFDFLWLFMYNFAVTIYFLWCLMGKIKNLIAWSLAVLWSVVPWQAMNNSKFQSQQGETSTEIATIFDESKNPSTIYLSQNPEKYTWIYAGFETNPEGLDREKIYNISLSEIPPEVLKYGMLRKINEIREEYWLKPLKYDKKLEKVAQDFSDDIKWTKRREPWHVLHEDSKWRDEYDRVQDAWLFWNYVEKSDESIRENMMTISGYNINTLFYDLMHSHFHKKAIISKYVNSVWFWYCRDWNTIIQLFWQVKKGL